MKFTNLGDKCFLISFKSTNILLFGCTNTNFLNKAAFEAIDVHSIDIILVSNQTNLLSLPFLTEYFKFHGKILATLPTVLFGKQLLIEMAHYNDEKYTRSIQPLSHFYDLRDIESCISKIDTLSYNQIVNIGALSICSVSSGYVIGSSNWIIKSQYRKISIITESSILSNHASPISIDPLMSSDVLIVSDLVSPTPILQQQKSPETSMNEICNIIGITLTNGGNILLPVSPSGSIFELFDIVTTYLNSMGMNTVPIFMVNVVAEPLMAYANIVSEWLCTKRQEKAYNPEPPFTHSAFVKGGKIQIFRTAADKKFSQSFHSPAIVFCGHPSLQCGDIVDLINGWKNEAKNSLILTDPDYDYTTIIPKFGKMKDRKSVV